MIERILSAGRKEEWKIPIITGGTTIPLVIILQIFTDGLYVIVPPFFAGLIAILLVDNDSLSGVNIGGRAGLINGLSLTYGGVDYLMSTSSIWLDNAPILLTVVTIVVLPFVVFIFILMYGAIGAIGGLLGSRILPSVGGDTSPNPR